MAKVSELKDRARALEKDGNTEKALQIYLHILKHLEGSPAIKRELPLYVKAGDLQRKLGERDAAIELYEKAGKFYSEHGSSKSVLALCAKILRVDPLKAEVHLHYSRVMIDRGHIVAARDVLADYAERAGLEQSTAALATLEGRPDDEAKPLLEMLLESASRGERASTERTAERVSVQLGALIHLPDEPSPAASPPDDPAAEEPAVEPEPKEATAEPEPPVTREPEPETEPPPSPVAEKPAVSEEAFAGMERSVDLDEPAEQAEEPTPEPIEASTVDAPAIDFSASVSEPEPPAADIAGPPEMDLAAPLSDEPAPSAERGVVEPAAAPSTAPSGVLTAEPPRSKKAIPVWVWVAAAVVVAGGGIVMMGGGGDEPSAPMQAASPAAPGAATDLGISPAALAESAGVTVGDSIAPEQDSAALALAVPAESAGPLRVAAAADSVRGIGDTPAADLTPGLEDSAAAVDSVPDSARVTLPPAQVVDTEPPPPPPPPVVAPAPATPGPVLAVEGLRFYDVSPFSQGGRTGYRVVQLLESGERLTIESSMIGPDSSDVPARGEVRVTAGAGGEWIGVTRYQNMLVTARGAVSADSMEAFLRRLVERSP